MWRAVSLIVIVGGVLGFSIAFLGKDVSASEHRTKPVAAVAHGNDSKALDTPAPPAPDPAQVQAVAPAAVAVHPSFEALIRAVNAIIAASGGVVGMSLIELGGPAPSSWEVGGSIPMEAASTYKLPALIEEAQLIAEGKIDPNGKVCFEDDDWENGWYNDYTAGLCLTRTELAQRAGMYSDNTAGHMLVRDMGGPSLLNAYADQLGATDSSFAVDGNETTTDDLAQLLAAEATGNAGGAKAQAWLYSKLTKTRWETGIPAGVPAGVQVIHKTGELDPAVDDAAIVNGGKNGPYALAIMTFGPGGDAGWSVIAQISAAVWAYEASR